MIFAYKYLVIAHLRNEEKDRRTQDRREGREQVRDRLWSPSDACAIRVSGHEKEKGGQDWNCDVFQKVKKSLAQINKKDKRRRKRTRPKVRAGSALNGSSEDDPLLYLLSHMLVFLQREVERRHMPRTDRKIIRSTVGCRWPATAKGFLYLPDYAETPPRFGKHFTLNGLKLSIPPWSSPLAGSFPAVPLRGGERAASTVSAISLSFEGWLSKATEISFSDTCKLEEQRRRKGFSFKSANQGAVEKEIFRMVFKVTPSLQNWNLAAAVTSTTWVGLLVFCAT